MLDMQKLILCFVLVSVLIEIGDARKFYHFKIPKHNPNDCDTTLNDKKASNHVCVYKDGEYLNFKSRQERDIAACFDDSFITAYDGLCREDHTFETMYTGKRGCSKGEICGTDNVTYDNLCELYTEKEKNDDCDLLPKHENACREDDT